jgi:tetratricopeptide (TPR) repeat protein
MQDYGVADVERLVRIPRATLKALVAEGFVTPARGARNAWRFSFRDLIVLRAAQALVVAEIPRRRIVRALRRLRSELPESMPLSGLNIGAIADQVVVREGGAARLAETGQYLLELDSSGVPHAKAGARSANWIPASAGMTKAPGAAPSLEARMERALTLHDRGDHDEALREYRDAVEAHGEDPVLLYNIAILLEDMEHLEQAATIYEAALRHDPKFADAHYNAALVYEQLGRGREAIRHMGEYRRLTRSARR